MINDKLGKLSRGHSPIAERKVGDIVWITAAELVFCNGANIDFDFSLGHSWPYSEANLDLALKDLTSKNPKSLRAPARKGKRLTIHNDHDNRILLIRIARKPDNLSFSSLNLPITAGTQNGGLFADLEIYGSDWAPGTPKLKLYDPATNTRGDTGGILAKFAIEGSAAPKGNFIADFNIAIDWRDFDSSGRETHVVPIMIDPDSRWPDGTDI